MNMQKEHRWLLLESSGELSARNRRRLQRALSKDPELAAYAEQLKTASDLQRQSVATPPDFSASRIEFQARRQTTKADSRDFMSLWQPALAYSAVALALGMTIVYMSKNWEAPGLQTAQVAPIDELLLSWEDPYLEDLNNMSLQFAQLDGEDGFGEWSIESMTDDLESIALELLETGES